MSRLPGPLGRAWGLARQPALTFDAIARAQPAPLQVLAGFVLPLTGVAAVAAVVGLAGVGLNTAGFAYKLGWLAAAQQAGVVLVAGLAGLWWMAQAAQRLASLFGARGAFALAWSAVGHAGAPLYLAGLLMVWPAVGRFAPLALFACVPLLHLGLRRLMQPAERRAVPYTAAVITAGVLFFLLLTLVSSCGPKELRPLELAEVPVELAPEDGAPSHNETTKAVTGAEKSQGSGAAVGVVQFEKSGAGEGELELVDGGAGLVPPGGQGMGQGSNPLTRTVLQDFLPAAPGGFRRDVVDSYAFAGPRDTAAGALMNGAFTKATYHPEKGARGTRSVSITDLTVHLGPQAAVQLLEEIGRTGGTSTSGRVQRSVTEEGERFVVTEFQDHADAAQRFAHVEWIIAERYKVIAEAEGLSVDELIAWAGAIDLAALEARAKAGKPVE